VDQSVLHQLAGRQLRGGFTIRRIELSQEAMLDAIGREAIARTEIVDRQLSLFIRSSLSRRELSVTIYHEILEAAAVAAINPPESLSSFNEGDFERAAYTMHEHLGEVSQQNLDQMLQLYGF
jgi:hypothetical protein